MDREQIRKQAKEILDKFSRALEKVSVEETRVEREEDRREEKEGEEGNSDFRKIMFENAPKRKGEFLEAEKGGWLE